MSEIVLEECHDEDGKYLGKVIISREALLMNVEEVFPNQLDGIPHRFHKKPFIEWIKADTEDTLGYMKYHDKLREAGFEV